MSLTVPIRSKDPVVVFTLESSAGDIEVPDGEQRFAAEEHDPEDSQSCSTSGCFDEKPKLVAHVTWILSSNKGAG
jgi:hypothetical protein